jgi:hypothetical protein
MKNQIFQRSGKGALLAYLLVWKRAKQLEIKPLQ